MTSDILPFYTSYAQMAHLDCPDFTSIGVKIGDQRIPNGIPGETRLQQFKSRGFDTDEVGGHNPNFVYHLTQSGYERAFSMTPVYPVGNGIYILDDRIPALLKSFNIGRNEFLRLEPPDAPFKTPNGLVYPRGITAIKIKERWPTLVPTHKAYHCEKTIDTNIFDYEPSRGEALRRTAFLQAQWFEKETFNWILPCFPKIPDTDIWVDPFLKDSLFLSKNLVDALQKEGLLQGEKYGWNVRPCRSASKIEIENDIITKKLRDIVPKTLANMSLLEFIKAIEDSNT